MAKSFYEKPSEVLLKAVPDDAETVLSIGAGSGATESILKERGLEVTALPLDSVIGASAEKRGIEVIYGTLEEGLAELEGARSLFDIVLVTNLLHLVPEPFDLIDGAAKRVAPGGTLLVSGFNLDGLPLFLRRIKAPAQYRGIDSYEKSGISVYGTDEIVGRIKANGLAVASLTRLNGDRRPRKFLRLVAPNWIVAATRFFYRIPRPSRSSERRYNYDNAS